MKRVDIRRMDELREEIGMQMNLIGRLVKSRLKWAGHLVRMEEERMAKRADRLREQGGRKLGRLWLSWEHCVRSDITKVGVCGEWREMAGDRGKWRSIVGVKNVDRRRMDELREEIGVQMSLMGEIGEMPAEIGWTLGAGGGRENGKEGG